MGTKISVLILFLAQSIVCMAHTTPNRDAELHFSTAAAITFGSITVLDQIKAPMSPVLSFLFVSGLAYLKEKTDPTFDWSDFRHGVYGSGTAACFTLFIRF